MDKYPFQVVSRGGFYVGNGINWKGQVFSKMRNHTASNKMTVIPFLNSFFKNLEYEYNQKIIIGVCFNGALI